MKLHATAPPLEYLWQHASNQNYPRGALYIVATPIGNLSDITIRALYVLSLCDAIACEDTRHSKPLLQQYGIQKPLLAVHEHNEAEAAQDLIAHLRNGERIALISDAGTPGISDPGARVVTMVRASGFPIIPLAGACAVTTAMSVVGLEGGFLFVGFLPNKPQARLNVLNTLSPTSTHLVFYESPHRLHETISALANVFPNHQLFIIKELSKLHENITTLMLNDTASWLKQAPTPRGEYILVVSGSNNHDEHIQEWKTTLTTLLAELPLKQAVSLTVKLTGSAKNKVYETALALKNAD